MNFPAPFSLTASTQLNSAAVFDHSGSVYARLPEGVSMVQVTFDGAGAPTVNLGTAESQSTRVPAATFPSGSGRRTLTIPGVGVPKGQMRFLSITSITSGTISVMVTTIPLGT